MHAQGELTPPCARRLRAAKHRRHVERRIRNGSTAIGASSGAMATDPLGAERVDPAQPDASAASSAPIDRAWPAIKSSKERARLNLYATLLALDILAIAAGFLIADVVRFGRPLETGFGIFMALAPIYVPIAMARRCYSVEVLAAPRRGFVRAFQSFLTAAVTLVLVLFLTKSSSEYSRVVLTLGIFLSLGLLILFRYGFGQAAGRAFNWVFINEILLVDGVPAYPHTGQIMVFAGLAELCPNANDAQNFNRLGRLLANCDRVTLACAPARRASWARALKGAGIDVEIMMPELDPLGALQYRSIGGRSALLVNTGPLGLRNRIKKRILDLSIAVPALLICLPVLLLIAVAIKMTSPGPILFRQTRVGRGNRLFEVCKFRTMHAQKMDAEGSRSASRNDERVTRIGRWLRSTSLDELPQLMNVLKGEMSIVGPRPHALGSTADDSLFWQIDVRYWERGAVKPGITGLAQVRGFRGATESREDLVNRLQADLEYLNGWTLWRDIGIILRTLKVLVHRNAY